MTLAHIIFYDYPPVIDPTVQVLECELEFAEARPGVYKHCRFRRLSAKTWQTLALPCGLTHIFGDAAKLEDCQALLVYDQSGLLRYCGVCDDRRWTLVDVDNEGNNAGAVFPSARLVFKDKARRNKFLRALRDMPPDTLEDWLQERVRLMEVRSPLRDTCHE
jgi:hypothetical protein